MLIRVRIERQHSEPRQLEIEEFHHLSALGIGHAVECLVAVCKRVFHRGHEIGLWVFEVLVFSMSFTGFASPEAWEQNM